MSRRTSMRISINWGIKLNGMLTAILFAWPQVGCSPSQVGEVPPSTQHISDVEPLAAGHKSGAKAHHDSRAGVPAKVAPFLRNMDGSHRAPAGYEGGRRFHNEGRGGERPLPQ